MPQSGENSAISDEEKKTLHECKWKDCKKEHERAIQYSENGTVDRNGSYATDWVNAGLEPWILYGPGTKSGATLTDYRQETPKAKYAINAAAMNHPAYHTQKHHLISINLFKNVTKLSHNAKLIDYDVNHKNNGICLPTYIADIIQHDLQCHRGNHPSNLYNSKIAPHLKRIQNLCIKYCTGDLSCDTSSQKVLMEDLNNLSRRIETMVKTWKWLLRKNALQERIQSQAMLNQRNLQN